MDRKTINLIIKIILTILALAAGVFCFVTQWPGRETVIATIYGVLYFLIALTLWLQQKQGWLQVIMTASFVVTVILTIAQAIAGIPLGVYQAGMFHSLIIVLLAAPGILGLIYFNLNTRHDNLDLLLVFMRIILSFEVGIIAIMLILMLEISGAMIWSLPQWGQYALVYGILVLAILDIAYAVINWLKFYRGKVVWITTILMIIEILACMPLFGMPTLSVIAFILIAIAILIFTAYLNNRIKSKK